VLLIETDPEQFRTYESVGGTEELELNEKEVRIYLTQVHVKIQA